MSRYILGFWQKSWRIFRVETDKNINSFKLSPTISAEKNNISAKSNVEYKKTIVIFCKFCIVWKLRYGIYEFFQWKSEKKVILFILQILIVGFEPN